MQQGVLDNYRVPEVAQEAFRGAVSRQIDDGVSIHQMAGHDKGVSYRFFIHQERNAIKSTAAKYWVPDSIEMIEWTVDKRLKPTERVKELPEELLAFDVDGECIGGRYKEAYLAWKAGRNAPGLSLAKWGILGDAEIASLSHAGIFSVEQFAATPRSKFEGRYPQVFIEAHEQAVEWVARKESRVDVEMYASQIVELQRLTAKKDQELEDLKEQVKLLLASNGIDKLKAHVEKKKKAPTKRAA